MARPRGAKPQGRRVWLPVTTAAPQPVTWNAAISVRLLALKPTTSRLSSEQSPALPGPTPWFSCPFRASAAAPSERRVRPPSQSERLSPDGSPEHRRQDPRRRGTGHQGEVRRDQEEPPGPGTETRFRVTVIQPEPRSARHGGAPLSVTLPRGDAHEVGASLGRGGRRRGEMLATRTPGGRSFALLARFCARDVERGASFTVADVPSAYRICASPGATFIQRGSISGGHCGSVAPPALAAFCRPLVFTTTNI